MKNGRDNRHAGESADADRIPEGSSGGDQRLTHRVCAFRARRDHRSGTETGFVGEEAERHAVAQGHHQHGSEEAAADCFQTECAGDDQFECGKECLTVDNDDCKAAEHIENGHERHKGSADAGDELESAPDDCGDQDRLEDSGRHRGNVEDFRGVAGNGVALHHASDTRACRQSENCKTDSKRFAVHRAFHDVHRTAADETVLAYKPVFNREESFCVFCCDSENAAEPAPEHRTGAAEDDRGRHADDVSGSDRRRKRNGECAVVGDFADSVRVLLQAQTDRQRNVPLDEFEAEGEKEVTSDEQ